MYAPKGGSQVGSPPVTPQTPQPKQEADGNLFTFLGFVMNNRLGIYTKQLNKYNLGSR